MRSNRDPGQFIDEQALVRGKKANITCQNVLKYSSSTSAFSVRLASMTYRKLLSFFMCDVIWSVLKYHSTEDARKALIFT